MREELREAASGDDYAAVMLVNWARQWVCKISLENGLGLSCEHVEFVDGDVVDDDVGEAVAVDDDVARDVLDGGVAVDDVVDGAVDVAVAGVQQEHAKKRLVDERLDLPHRRQHDHPWTLTRTTRRMQNWEKLTNEWGRRMMRSWGQARKNIERKGVVDGMEVHVVHLGL